MKDTTELAELIRGYGEALHGNETPEEVASQWAEALPEASLMHFQEWFDSGFWSPDVARALADAGVSPREVTCSMAYDLCNGDLSVSLFLQARRY